PTRRRSMRQRTCGQRIKANDGIAITAGIAHHEAVAGTLTLVTQRPRLQPLCKGIVATGESIEPMVESQPLGWTQPHASPLPGRLPQQHPDGCVADGLSQQAIELG